MTQAAPSKNSTNLFEVYKRGQGKSVRLGTAAAAGLLLGLGLYWLWKSVLNLVMNESQDYLKAGITLVLGLAGAYGIFLLVNRPRTADFMILTESELRKVNWPSRTDIIRSTQIVIVLTLLLAVMLYVADAGFIFFFQKIGILPASST